MVTFVIIRHGFSKSNKEKKFAGQADIPLDEIGVMQAEKTAEYVLKNYKIDAIYSSDLSRAYNTAKPIADALNLPIIAQKNLRELNLGYWQGKTHEEVQKEFPESYRIMKENPSLTVFDGGESYMDGKERALKTIEEIAGENDGKTVLIASHGAFIRSLLWGLTGVDSVSKTVDVSNASVTVLNYDKGNAEILLSGYNKHLDEKMSQVKVY